MGVGSGELMPRLPAGPISYGQFMAVRIAIGFQADPGKWLVLTRLLAGLFHHLHDPFPLFLRDILPDHRMDQIPADNFVA